MEYIKKSDEEPTDWNSWFKTANGRRSFNYKADEQNLTDLPKAKAHLLSEQNGLCAYCQRKLKNEEASIEHVIPKEYNVELSTSYYNLVAVCKKAYPKDPLTRRGYCEKERGSNLLPSIIFHGNSKVSEESNQAYLTTSASGEIIPKETLSAALSYQVWAFIEVLNLNHQEIKSDRKKSIDGYMNLFISLSSSQKGIFWETVRTGLLMDTTREFRHFLLSFISPKTGRS